ncbi:MAG: serine--tRNA ligase [Pseudanabaenaceae cyanobacterium]
MLDIKLIRTQSNRVKELLRRRQADYSGEIDQILAWDQQLRQLEVQRSQLQSQSNDISKQVGQKLRAGAEPEAVEALKEKSNQIKQELADLEPQERTLREQIHELLLRIPNLPSETVPVGKDETENVEIYRWGDEYKCTLTEPKSHWEIGEQLGILQFERAVKIAQTRFVALVGAGAHLERAIAQFMLETHIQRGYVEILPPLLVNSATMTGTGQLPKFANDLFRCAEDDLWLIPTAEVPVTNFYRDEILEVEQLPIKHCAFTPCFRREAGSYGRDTKGLIRLHQFHKVELVQFTTPETSAEAHQNLLQDAELILKLLKLPYRVVELCTGDLGFGAAKCYDLEVWLPSAQQYREISSVSNFLDFQARRANLRCKQKGRKGTEFIHTLNGSGLAIGRTMTAILENYQQADGRVKLPEVLQPLMGREYL